MAYCTQVDISNAGVSSAVLIQLADDDGDGVADAAVIAAAIADADAEINSYLGARYRIPVAPVPPLLVKLSTAMAVWNLYGHRGLTNERRRHDYQDAVALLRRLQEGSQVLPGVVSGEVAADGADLPASSTAEADRVFRRGTSDGSSGILDLF